MNQQLRQTALENTKRRLNIQEINNDTTSLADSTSLQIRNGSDSYVSRMARAIERRPPFVRQAIMLVVICIVTLGLIWVMGVK